MYKLHAFAQSGNAFKVAVLLQALRQTWTAIHMPFSDFAAGVPRSDAWRQEQNAMGEVPILEVDGQKMTQSAAILLYLSNKHREFGGDTESERQEVLRWLFFDNHKFTSYFASWRFTKAFAPVAPDPSVEKWLRGRIDNAFGIAERHLANREYVVGNKPTIADISMSGYMYYPAEESGYELAKQYPAIARWAERLKQLPGWKPPYELLPGERVAPRW